MILLVVAAVLGALLGLVLRTAPLAVVVAAGLAGAAQLGAMSLARVLAGRAGTAPLAGAIEAAVGVHPGAIAPTLAAAGCGAAIAALLLSWADNRKPSVALIPGDMTPGGERRRRRGAVLAAIEARSVHAVAEDRIQRILKQ